MSKLKRLSTIDASLNSWLVAYPWLWSTKNHWAGCANSISEHSLDIRDLRRKMHQDGETRYWLKMASPRSIGWVSEIKSPRNNPLPLAQGVIDTLFSGDMEIQCLAVCIDSGERSDHTHLYFAPAGMTIIQMCLDAGARQPQWMKNAKEFASH